VPTPDGDPRNPRLRSARGPARLVHAVRALEPEQRIAAGAALALWASMFLPWYGKSVTETVQNSLRAAGYDLTAFGAFSFVEAAVLLVAAAVLLLLFARAERRAFHLPGGDGLVILAGGVWVSLLIFYRMLDKPGTTGNDRLTTTVGLQWGIFVAMAASISLAYAGARVRAAHRPEPALGDDPTVPRSVTARPAGRRPTTPAARRAAASSRPRAAGPPTFEEPTAARLPPRRAAPPAYPPDASVDPPAPPAYPPTPPFDADAVPRPPVVPSGPPRPPSPPFDANADADAGAFDRARRRVAPASDRLPPEDTPTRVNRRVPRFDDLDAEWISADDLSLETDPPPPTDPDR
jgi:hypothetical protein